MQKAADKQPNPQINPKSLPGYFSPGREKTTEYVNEHEIFIKFAHLS